MTAFSGTWDGTFESLPPDSEGAKLGAGRLRNLKRDIRERMVVDHAWAGDAEDGKHNQVTLKVRGSKPVLSSPDGALYVKVVNGHTTLFFEDEAGNEIQVLAPGFSTGDAKLTLKTTPDFGWVMADDGTIGNAGSAATNRANADTINLYTLLWTNCVDADCPVTGGRGGSASLDFNALKPIKLPLALGRALAIAGTGSGLTARALGHALGEETHQLTTAELASHTHNVTLVDTAGSPTRSARDQTGVAQAVAATSSTGSDTPHNNMQPTTFLNVMIKL